MDKHIPLRFRINYPRKPRAGVRYLITVDVDCELQSEQWPYAEEEYPVTCFLDAGRAFIQEAAGDSTIVVHRFGGSYGPAKFWLTAQEPGQASIRYVLVNRAGVPIASRSASVEVVEQLRPQAVVDAGSELAESMSQPLPKPDARSARTRVFRWLHLGDLHYRAGSLQPLIDDVRRGVDAGDVIDAVIVTGDLTMHGTKEEFDGVGKFLRRLQESIQGSQQTWPVLIVVPGNHDAERKDPSNRGALVVSQDRNPDFWRNEQGSLRQSVERAFHTYESWRLQMETFGGNVRGILPGDFSVSREFNGIRVGIVGLNDSSMAPFRTFGVDSPSLDRAQLDAVCGDVGQWARQHDLRILLTHHAPPQFSPETRQRFFSDISPRWLFDVRLYASWQGKDLIIDDGHPDAIGCNAAPKSDAWSSRGRGYRIGEASVDGEGITVRVQGRQMRRHDWGADVSDRTDEDGVRVARLTTRPLPPPSSVSTAPARNRYALVVGIDRTIELRMPSLQACVRDALALNKELQELGYSTTLLTEDAATATAIVQSLKALCRESGPDDLLVLFFAGRSYWSNRRTRLASHDLTLDGGGVLLEDILEIARQSGRRLLVLGHVGRVSLPFVPPGTGVVSGLSPEINFDRGMAPLLIPMLRKAATTATSVLELARAVYGQDEPAAERDRYVFVRLSPEIEQLTIAEAGQESLQTRGQRLLERFRTTYSRAMLARAALLEANPRPSSRIDPLLWKTLGEGHLIDDFGNGEWQFLADIRPLLRSVAAHELLAEVVVLWIGDTNHPPGGFLASLSDLGASLCFTTDMETAWSELRKRKVNIVVVERREGTENENMHRAAEFVRNGWRMPVILLGPLYADNLSARLRAMSHGIFACASNWPELLEWICEVAGRTIGVSLTTDQRFLRERLRAAGAHTRDAIDEPDLFGHQLLGALEDGARMFERHLQFMRDVSGAAVCQIVQLTDEQPVIVAAIPVPRRNPIGMTRRRLAIERAARSVEPQWIPNLEGMQQAQSTLPTSRSMLSIPLHNARVVGVVQIELSETEALDKTTRGWLERFCAPIAALLRNFPEQQSSAQPPTDAASSEPTLMALYEAECTRWGFMPDAGQRAVVEELENLRARLMAPPPKRGLRNLLSVQEPRKAERGLYIWGGPGRGKTSLMNIFFRSLRSDAAERSQFHRFMEWVHEQLRELANHSNPLDEIVDRVARRTRVLCLDDLIVTDIADAMILSSLLKGLFAAGVTLVATSRLRASELYAGGLQRARFLPAIDFLQEHTVEMELRGEIDYRSQLLSWTSTWLDATNEQTTTVLEDLFEALAHEPGVLDGAVAIRGVRLQARRLSHETVWFEFDDICRTRRSQGDYDELARSFRTVFVSGVPELGAEQETEARRFAGLVDSLYDYGSHLIVSAHTPISSLYRGALLNDVFERTSQRLIEMQSEQYSSRKHGLPP